MLQQVGVHVAEPRPARFNGLDVEQWPQVTWHPSFAQVLNFHAHLACSTIVNVFTMCRCLLCMHAIKQIGAHVPPPPFSVQGGEGLPLSCGYSVPHIRDGHLQLANRAGLITPAVILQTMNELRNRMPCPASVRIGAGSTLVIAIGDVQLKVGPCASFHCAAWEPRYQQTPRTSLQWIPHRVTISTE